MVDNPKITGPQDPTKVNVNQDHEVHYWTKKWGITEKELRDAVSAVDVMVKDIEAYLRRQGKI